MEVACYSYEGIDAVKNALSKGFKYSTEEYPIKVSYFLGISLVKELNLL